MSTPEAILILENLRVQHSSDKAKAALTLAIESLKARVDK